MRILVVRLSALGDIVQALPALTDLRLAHPQALIEVATDERFADVPLLHAGVDRVIPLALKRWKNGLRRLQTWRELVSAVRALRAHRYDLVVDLQGLNKSAIVTWLARSKHTAGPSVNFCGEALAPRLYDQALDPPYTREPVPRMKMFMAHALGRPLQPGMDYGMKARWAGPGSRQVALIHSASTQDKLWPEAHWVALGRDLVAQGLEPVLLWGSQAELERAQRLAQGVGQAHCQIGVRQSLGQWATDLSRCRLVVGLDTGLTHLAAAAGVPCLALFVVTGPSLFAPQQPAYGATLGGLGVVPELSQVQAQVRQLLQASAAAAA